LRNKLAKGLLVALTAAAAAFWWLPPRPLFREPVSSVLLARDGSLLGARIAADGQWRFPDLEAAAAFAAARSPTRTAFYDHAGVICSPWRARCATTGARRVVSGASTLTMQLRAWFAITKNGAPRTPAGKITGGVAVRLELTWSKDELLALHASHAALGGNVVTRGRPAILRRAPKRCSAEVATLPPCRTPRRSDAGPQPRAPAREARRAAAPARG
jgi:penicillin-binding protein 1C